MRGSIFYIIMEECSFTYRKHLSHSVQAPVLDSEYRMVNKTHMVTKIMNLQLVGKVYAEELGTQISNTYEM